MTYIYILIVLALFGVGETVYLILKRRQGQKPICIGKDDCNIVLQSKYNKTFGIYNDSLGLVFYVFAFTVHCLILFDFSFLNFEYVFGDLISILMFAFWIGLITAVVMSIRFIYLMAFQIKAWCQWCVGSAITVILMALIVFLNILPIFTI